MPTLPPLECLRFFEVAARHESFVKAAAELSVSASAVAHRVKVLEAYLDGALFKRGPRGVRLTGRGKAYLQDVQRILDCSGTRSVFDQDGWRTCRIRFG